MFCRKCGQEIKPGAKFCTKCGTPVSSASQVTATDQVPPKPQVTPAPQIPPKPQATPAPQVPPKPQVTPAPQVPTQTVTKNKKEGKGLIIGLICLIIILLAIGAVLIIYMLKQSEDNGEVSDNENKSTQEQFTTEEILQTEAATQTEKVVEDVATESTESVLDSQSESTEAAVPHTYKIEVADVTWTEAYQQAKSVTNGHLVTFETQEEMDQVLAQIKQEGYENMIFMIGMTRRDDSEDYHWIDAEGDSIGGVLNSDANWLEGEPTLYDEQNSLDERYVDMFYSKSAARWVWNDVSNDVIGLLPYYSGKVAYIVEVE